MTKQLLTTDLAPRSALFSQGIRSGSSIHVSGMTGLDPATGAMAGPTIRAQIRQSLCNCRAVVEAGGGTLADVVQVTVLLADPADFAGMNEQRPSSSRPIPRREPSPGSGSTCPASSCRSS